MTPISLTPPYTVDTVDKSKKRGLIPSTLRSVNARSDSRFYRPNRPELAVEGWTPRLRPRPSATNTRVSSPHTKKRKFLADDCPLTPKKRKKEALQNLKDTSQTVARQKLGSAKPPKEVGSTNGPLYYNSRTLNLNPTYEGDKRKKRKREASLFEDPLGNGNPPAKRCKPVEQVQPLSQKNLKLLEKDMSTLDSVKSQSESAATSSKRSRPIESSSRSSQSSRAYAAKDARFEVQLKGFNVDFGGLEEPDEEEITRILEVMKKRRDSPEPDAKHFHETRRLVKSENEAKVISKLSPLLLVQRELPSDNSKTRNLLYRQDVPWAIWGSIQPGILPTPKPDFCISYKDSAFSLKERKQMVSPYIDKAGFAPFLFCEVKTALQGDRIADRQNANNVIRALQADFDLQRKLGRESMMEKKIRIITMAHNTGNQWYDGWFYVLDQDGKPRWCPHRLKHVNFEIPNEHGYESVRQYNLNLCEYFNGVVLPKLQADLAEASSLNLSLVTAQLNSTPSPRPDTQAHAKPQDKLNNQPLVPPEDSPGSEADVPSTKKRAMVITRSAARHQRSELKSS